MTFKEVIETVPSDLLDTLGGDAFTALFIPKEQTWRRLYQDLIRDEITITDPIFLDHMKQRLGWEYFVDLSYRAHFSHTLEVNGVAVADISADLLRASAERLASELRNELPGAPDLDSDLLAGFLSGVVQRMRRQGSVAHPYLVSAIATASGRYGLNWFAAQQQVGVRRTGAHPAPDSRRGLAPIPVTLHNPPIGFERITKAHVSNWYRDWLFRTLGQVDIRYGTDPDTIYPIVMRRLEAVVGNMTGCNIDIETAIKSAIRRWQDWRISRQTEREEGIPAGLPYLTGWVQHFAVTAAMAEPD